jgi:tetratricopeptide (TPR) repeat protein
LAKLGPANWSPTRKAGLALALSFLIVAGAVSASFFFLGPAGPDEPEIDEAYEEALNNAWNWVDGSEAAPIFTKPPWLEEFKKQDDPREQLAAGVEAFLDFRFEDALKDFETLLDQTKPDPRVLSLLAATNLRLLNYGQAKAQYAQALALSGLPQEQGGLKEASDRLGLALALFHQQDYDNGLNEAGISWRIRHKELGPADSKTLAAVNAMATSLMALSRSAVAGDLLLDAVSQAIEAGADQTQPVIRDSLSILFLAFEAQGRVDELRAYFTEPVPETPEGAPEGEAPGAAQESAPEPEAPPDSREATDHAASAPEDSPPAEAAPPIQATQVAFNRDEARGIIEYFKAHHAHSRVLPALSMALARDLTPQGAAPCHSPYPPEHFNELFSLCLDVARGYASINELTESTAILDELTRNGLASLAEKNDLGKPTLIEALTLLASERAELKEFPAAETALRQARDIAATLPKGETQTLTNLIILSLRLSDLVLAENRPGIEAEMELVAGLTTAKKLFTNKAIETHPLSSVLYLRLAWLVGSLGRSKDANNYRQLAERSLKAAEKAYPRYKNAIDRVWEVANQKGQGDTDRLSHLWRPVLPANRPAQPPASPEVMRVELAALKLLNRLPEFSGLIDAAITWSAQTHGVNSPAHRRYQSLNLKFLEESGNLPALLTALDSISADPQIAQEPDRTLIMTGALRYKARVLEKAGQTENALEALTQARVKILDNHVLTDRLPEIEAEISRLSVLASNPR